MKILIVDDDSVVVESLEIILSSEPDFNVVGSANNGQQAIAFCREHQVDLVLMDIQMPVLDGISACRMIKNEFDNIKVIMLTTFHDFKNVHQSLHAGASGYLLKSDEFEKQKTTIKSVYSGLSIISEDALKSLTERHKENKLTPRENDIVELIANGLSNKEISQHLYIGEGTVRNTISIILEKLMLRDRTQIAIYYWQNKM